MREILFRGRTEKGKWIYGVPFEDYDGNMLVGNYGSKVKVIPETVGQYTGLTDKNGNKIFEGDIVKDGYLLGDVKYATGQSGFDGMAGFMVDDIYDGLQNYNGFWHHVEVIGNIHDNPELLKDGETK